MTIEEAIEELKRIDTDLLKTADCGNKTIERMTAGRGRKAMRLAIKAIENQERIQRELKSLDGIAETCDKLEKALQLSCDKISCLYCVLHDVHPCEETHEQCVKRKAQYFKRRAGIEVAENDE